MKIRNILLSILFVVPFFFSIAQNENNPEIKPVVLNGTEVHKLVSSISGVTYPIYISLPGSYNSGNKYPVVYMLDAYSSFGTMTQMAKLLAFSKEIPELIIVGISSEGGSKEFIYNRARDFTPTKVSLENLPEGLHTMTPTSGGADQFIEYIEKDLIPFVESNYNFKQDERTLVGHSYGGLFCLYTLFTEPDLFNRYVSISPALFWDDEYLIKLERNFFTKNKNLNKTLYIAVGKMEPEYFVNPFNKLITSIREHNYSGLNLITKTADDETHYSIIPYIATHGLINVFYDYVIE